MEDSSGSPFCSPEILNQVAGPVTWWVGFLTPSFVVGAASPGGHVDGCVSSG